MRKYNPDHNLDAAEWLALDEDERLLLVREYHRRARVKLPNIEAHSTAHAIVENQLAEGLPEATRALNRLLESGLNRHESIHAIASVLMDHIWNLTNKPLVEGDPHAPYLAGLEQLTAESWRRSG
jgi:hypothetical protein